ncbi:MAG: prephenate dehydratase [Gammaproteobacteria bacterium]
MSKERKLQSLRDSIDTLDDQLLQLISERARLAQQAAGAKREGGKDAEYYRPEREVDILRRVQEHNPGPLSNGEIARLFREIMSACLALEQPMSVAFLGPEGTFTQAATHKHFGRSVSTVPMVDIGSIFREVESGAVQYGVVPVENSTEGMIHHTLDMFLNSPLRICGEVELRIHHYLLGCGGGIETVERVYAHPQALAQCRSWLDTHLARAERIGLNSNAEGARKAETDSNAAAIAGSAAAKIYGLKVLASNIEDRQGNTTRFLVIGDQDVAPSGKDKTSLLVSVKNQPGALYRLLEPMGRNNISMTRIESRPSRRAAWDYVFFVDFEGHVTDKAVADTLVELEAQAAFLKVLGSYPAAAPQ